MLQKICQIFNWIDKFILTKEKFYDSYCVSMYVLGGGGQGLCSPPGFVPKHNRRSHQLVERKITSRV
jgi:hypothetical protein